MSQTNSQPPDPPALPPSSPKTSPQNVPLAIIWAIAVAILGGYLCGLAISQFGWQGSISLWGLGALAGHFGRKILKAPCRPVAWCLVAACAAAFVLAEICWIRWETVQGQEGWWAAAGRLLQFVREAPRPAFIGALFAGLGAYSAYQQTARRYRIVMVVEE